MQFVLCEEKSDVEKLLHRRDHVGRVNVSQICFAVAETKLSKKKDLLPGHIRPRAPCKKKRHKLLFVVRQTTTSTTMTKDYMEKQM